MTVDSSTLQQQSSNSLAPTLQAQALLGPAEFELCAVSADQNLMSSIVVAVGESGELSKSATVLDEKFGGLISQACTEKMISGALGSVLFLPVFVEGQALQSILLVGIGDSVELPPRAFQQILRSAFACLNDHGVKTSAVYLSEILVTDRDNSWKVCELVSTYHALAYRYSSAPQGTLESVQVHAQNVRSGVLKLGGAIALATNVARQLADAPPNICTPRYLAAVVEGLANETETLKVNTLNEEKMADLGMHVLLSVGRGSAEPSCLIEISHMGGACGDPTIVIVGKGITFDTGGTALKTRDAMRLMKYDMCGVATVVGVMRALAELNASINVVGICACAENMPGARATRPSDVVRSMSGKTVEIINPDAEGRLVLCDALTYAKQFNPSAIVDVATLTGASVVALGHHYAALFANDDSLAQELLSAGEHTLDCAWRMPLSELDESQLDSEFADCANMGDGSAAAVVAALFLAKFAEGVPWAHLDISGIAKQPGRKAVSTGRPVAMLMQFLLARVDKAAQ